MLLYLCASHAQIKKFLNTDVALIFLNLSTKIASRKLLTFSYPPHFNRKLNWAFKIVSMSTRCRRHNSNDKINYY